jgi:dolichyl-phosphate-mannose-protein mannosyltransferase
VLAGAWLLLARRLPQLRGSARLTAYGLLATLGLLAVHLLPAALGILARGTVLAAAAVWVAAATLTRPVAAGPAPAPEPLRPASPAEWAIAGVAATILGGFAIAVAAATLTVPVAVNDALVFHLPGVAAWIESGSIWQIDVFLADVFPGHYPNNGDLVLLASVLPWHNEFAAHFAIWPFWALSGVATYGLGRELRATRPAALAAACVLLAIPVVSQPALVGMLVDSLMLFGLAAGILFLVRHHRSGARPELVLAGLALGVSFGTKWYGVSSVLAVIGIWALARWAATRDLRTLARQLAAVCGLVALVGGIWLLRNLVESGNPVFPVDLSPLFDAPPDPIRDAFGFTIADYLFDRTVWSDYLWPLLRDALALPTLVLGAAALAAGAHVLRRRGETGEVAAEERLVLLGLGMAMLLAAVYAITPYSAGGPEGMPFVAGADARYLVPALVLAAPLGAWLASTSRGTGIFFGLLAVAAVLQGCRLVGNGTVGALELGAKDVAIGAVGAVALIGLPVLAIGLGKKGLSTESSPPSPPWAERLNLRIRNSAHGRRAAVAAVAGLVSLVLLTLAGYSIQERFNDDRYRGRDEAVDWVLVNAAEGRRVGLAGVWAGEGISPVWPAFGEQLGNEVAYVGNFEDDVYRRFRRERDFIAALREGDYDVLIVGRGRIPQRAPTPEELWALDAGYRLVARSERLSVFEKAAG